jgi:competence protein ComEC
VSAAETPPPSAPIIYAAGAWLSGTLAIHQLPELPGAAWCAPAVLTALVALRSRRLRPLLWLLAGAVWTGWLASERLAERLPYAALGRDFAVEGIVASFPAVAPGQATFAFAVAEPRPPDVPDRLRLTWYDPPSAVRPGAAFAVTARLRPPRGARNPGGFDYEQWLFINDYGATGYVRAAAAAEPGKGLAARWLGFRATLAERIAAAARDADGAALLTALALGERHLFSEQHWDDFRRTGTSHLVAISGMHVALLGLFVFAALKWSCVRLPAPVCNYDLEIAAAGSGLATAYYAALTGFAVPAQRSLLMIVVALCVLVARRSVSPMQVLAATLLAVLAFDPFAPLAASFWLSFVAVALLLALAAPHAVRTARRSLLQRGVVAVGTFVRLQWWIGLALVPLTLWYFGEISLIGAPVNLGAIPFFNLVLVPLAVLATVALSYAAFVDIAAPLVGGVADLATATVACLHALASSPAAAYTLPRPSWPAFAVAALGVAFAVGGVPLPRRWLGWLALLPLFVPVARAPPPGTVHAVVLDVGHGLAVLIATTHHRLLFDAGPKARSGFDAGAEVVLPALAATGRRDLDLMIVSHADNDHAGGAAAVAGAYRSSAILKGPDVDALPGRTCTRGEHWEWDGVRFVVLHPSAEFAARGNESSCVLKVIAGDRALLVTGDVEQRGEKALLDQPLAADVVVVPHHGSATSSSPAFVAAVDAEHAIVSAGFANRWGFPRPEVRARWQSQGATVIVTGDVGAIGVVLGPAGVRLEAERDRRHRYWQVPKFPW